MISAEDVKAIFPPYRWQKDEILMLEFDKKRIGISQEKGGGSILAAEIDGQKMVPLRELLKKRLDMDAAWNPERNKGPILKFRSMRRLFLLQM